MRFTKVSSSSSSNSNRAHERDAAAAAGAADANRSVGADSFHVVLFECEPTKDNGAPSSRPQVIGDSRRDVRAPSFPSFSC